MKRRLPDSRTLHLTSHIIFCDLKCLPGRVSKCDYCGCCGYLSENVRLRLWLVEKVELVKTTEKSYGLIADKICCPMDKVLIDKLLVRSTGSNVVVSKSFEACYNR